MWQHFSNVVVLQLFISSNEVLDLRGLRCLRSLELHWGGHEDRCFPSRRGYKGGGTLIGLGELRNLGWLELRNIHYAPCFEEIGCLTALEVLRLDTNCDYSCEREPLSPPNLDECIHLRELVLRQCVCLKALPDLNRLKSLRKVLFKRCNSAIEVVGLSSQMCALRELFLIHCESLCHIPGLGDLVPLHELGVIGCSKLRQLPDFHKLTNLRRLNIGGKFTQVLGFSDSMLLQELLVGGLVELPDLHLLRNLQRLSFSYFHGSILPRFGRFIALDELIFVHLPEVRELPDLHKLSRLQRFTIDFAPKLVLLLPVLGDLVALQYLSLTKCGTSVGIAELPNLHRLTNLQVLELSQIPIQSLPSLECLTQLRDLRCSFMLLAELPNLSGSKLLERINLSGCHQLMSLGSLHLPAVEYLNVATCYRLGSLPNLRSSRRLGYLSLCHSGVRLSSEDIMVLATLLVSDVFVCDHFHVRFLETLDKMPFAEVMVKIEAKQLEFFATLQSMDWHVTHICMHDMTVSTVGSISDRSENHVERW